MTFRGPALFLPLLIAAAAISACDSPHEAYPVPEVEAGVVRDDTLGTGLTSMDLSMRTPATRFKLLFQAASHSPRDTLVASVVDRAGTTRVWLIGAGTDTSLYQRSSAWVTPAAGDTFHITITRRSGSGEVPFAVSLLAPSPQPEHVPSAIELGQPVTGERIEFIGDVDEFRRVGEAGEEWIAFLRNGAPGEPLRVEVVDSTSGAVLSDVAVWEATPALESRSTGRLVLPHSGTYLLRVSSEDPFHSEVRPGPAYSLRLDAVHRAPETGTATLAPGVVVTEEIASVGDIDEWRIDGHAG